jgi:hypothetical protein
MTKKQALKNGFTHHGRYFGIPIYITDEECPMVCATWAPCEFLIDIAHIIEGILHSIFWPNEQPCFQFLVCDKISV